MIRSTIKQIFWSSCLVVAFLLFMFQVLVKYCHKPAPDTSDLRDTTKPQLFISNGQLKQAESKGLVIEYRRRSGPDPLLPPDSIGIKDTLYMLNDSIIVVKYYTDSQ